MKMFRKLTDDETVCRYVLHSHTDRILQEFS